MKIQYKDKLKILTIASAKIDQYSIALEEYLVNFFGKAKYLYSRTNIYGQLLQVTKDIANLLFFYHEDAVTENNILTAQKEVSIRHYAEISGYNVTRVISSTGVIRLELKPTFFSKFGSPVYIRKNAVLKNNQNSLVYLVDINEDQKVIDSSSINVYLPLIEGSLNTSTFTADGSKLFVIDLSASKIIETSHIRVLVNNKEYTKCDSLFDMTYNQESYFIKTGFLSQYQIIFGNTNNGKCLSKGDIITIEYITSVGEYGNFDETLFPKFDFISGMFDSTGQSIDTNDYINAVKESGFLMGSNGDSVSSLRAVTGYSSRGNILVDARSCEAYLSKYSFLSKIYVWNSETNRKINNILVLPNLMQKLRTADEYFTRPIEDFTISGEMKTNIIESITNSELAYLANEMIWIDPNFIKYAAMVYLEPVEPFINTNEIYESVKSIFISEFINVSFSRTSLTQNIAKSNIIAQLQNILGDTCRISVIFVSSINESAKINRYYNAMTIVNGVQTVKRIEVPFGTDPCLGLSDRNDIVNSDKEVIPILRAGFNMLSSSGESIEIIDPVNLYVIENNDWKKIN